MFSAHTLSRAADQWRTILARFPFARRVARQIQAVPHADTREALRILYAFSPLSDWGNYPFELFRRAAEHAVFLRRQAPGALSEALFCEYVLPLRVNEEALSDCRALFHALLAPRIEGLSAERAILEINYWCAENMTYRSTDVRTISALDAYRSAYGRCGEESTFLVNALRAVGFAARQIYTPRWAHCDDNHAWVEVWLNGEWRFLGACEPEEMLDRAWFNSAANRAMLIHSRTFESGARPDFLARRGAVTYLNQTARYAPTTRLTVRVRNADGAPIAGAKASFGILNMGEIYPVAQIPTDSNGEAVLECGLGSLFVRAMHENRAAEALIDTRDGDCIDLLLPGDAQNAQPFADRAGASVQNGWQDWAVRENRAAGDLIDTRDGDCIDLILPSDAQNAQPIANRTAVSAQNGWQDWAVHGNRAAESLIDTRNGDRVDLILPGDMQNAQPIADRAAGSAQNRWQDWAVRAPVGNGARMPQPSPEQAARAAERNAAANRLRAERVRAMLNTANALAGEDADLLNLFRESRSNCERLAKFLANGNADSLNAPCESNGNVNRLNASCESNGHGKHPASLLANGDDFARRRALLHSLSQKDLRDVTVEVLEDALIHANPDSSARISDKALTARDDSPLCPRSSGEALIARNDSPLCPRSSGEALTARNASPLCPRSSGEALTARNASPLCPRSSGEALAACDDSAARKCPAPDCAAQPFNESAHPAMNSGGLSPAFYRDYVLCPRVSDEMLAPVRAEILERFGEAERRDMAENPARVADWIRKHIRCAPELDYDALFTTPAAALRAGFASPRSQDVLFVAICRTLGVPARLNPADLQPEYWQNGAFVAPRPRTATLSLVRPAGAAPKYFEDFTIARLDRGEYRTLDLSAAGWQGDALTFPAEPGEYRLLTANRLPNGDIHASALQIRLGAGENRSVELHFFPAQLSEMLADYPIGDFALDSGASIASVTSGGAILMRLDPGAEPTEHLLGEILAQADAFDALRPVFVLSGSAHENELLHRVLARFPNAPVLTGGSEAEWALLARQVYVDPDKLPLAIVADRSLHAIYAASGYNVGLASMLVKIAKNA